MKSNQNKNLITVLVSTFERYDSTLPICLLSLANQSRLPDRIVLIDDNQQKKFYEKETFKNIISYFKLKGIVFDYYHGISKGATHALQIGLEKIESGWVLKIDDDNSLDYDAIRLFENNISDNIGAMGGKILDYKLRDDIQDHLLPKESDGYYSKIKNIFFEFNIQLIRNQTDEIKKVEHIHSNYFFRRDLVDSYPLELTPSCHREDTIVTHEIFRKGFDLIVIPQAKTYHLSSHKNSGDGKWDDLNVKNELIFIEKLKNWNIIPDFLEVINNNGNLYAKRNDEKFLVMDQS